MCARDRIGVRTARPKHDRATTVDVASESKSRRRRRRAFVDLDAVNRLRREPVEIDFSSGHRCAVEPNHRRTIPTAEANTGRAEAAARRCYTRNPLQQMNEHARILTIDLLARDEVSRVSLLEALIVAGEPARVIHTSR